MKNELLDSAKECLHIIDVHASEVHVTSDDRHEFSFPEFENVEIQLKHSPRPIVAKYEYAPTNDAKNKFNVVRFEYEAGFRVIVKGCDPINILAEVTAVFRAIYKITDANLTDEALHEFSRLNVGYHVWPYWREFSSSMASRLRIPNFTLPLYHIPKVVTKNSTAKIANK